MGRLVVVYGMDSELEEALDRLRSAGLGEAARVVQGAPEDGGADGAEPAATPEDGPRADVIVPPSATLGASGAMGTPAAVSPYAAPGAQAEAERAGAGGWTLAEIEDITGSRGDEARHLQRVVAGGGSLLVVEGGRDDLDEAETALAGHTGQGSVRR